MKHIVGTFVIHADATFLNGAGLAQGGEDKNVVIPKTLWQLINGRPTELPYVSAQSFRRWLRNTANEDNNWVPSDLHSIGESAKGSTNKIATLLDPVIYPEDDLFGYMKAVGKEEKKSKKGAAGEEGEDDGGEQPIKAAKKVQIDSIQRTSPFRNSIIKAIPGAKINRDEAFVHLKEGTPLPYATKFYVAHLQGIFGLDLERLGRFVNIGSKVEIEPEKVTEYLAKNKLTVKNNTSAKTTIYELSDRNQAVKERVAGLLKSLVRLRGGAKMAAFGADVSPKIIILAVIEGGNLIFNDLFEYGVMNPKLKIGAFTDAISGFSDRIKGKVYVGFRSDYLENHTEIPSEIAGIQIQTGNPMEVLTHFLRDHQMMEDNPHGQTPQN
jgi:CRISPR-associated protein Cst2